MPYPDARAGTWSVRAQAASPAMAEAPSFFSIVEVDMAGGGYAFSQVPKAQIPRSSFVRNHGYKTTFNSGLLIPFYVDEALPGDTFKVKVNVFARLATPIVPVMDNLYLDMFFFAVPNRLLWDNWQKFMGEQENPGDSTDFLVPEVVSPAPDGFAELSLWDYFGIPTKIPDLHVSALWPRAYTRIWNEWFRDENLQDKVVQFTDDGPDPVAGYDVLRRGKRHDYFTSCLPWPQKGPGVMLPLGTTAPVIGNPTQGEPKFVQSNQIPSSLRIINAGAQDVNWGASGTNLGEPLVWASDTGLLADLTNASAATINSLRQAFQVQKLLERDARGGTRYIELLKSHFGVTSPDARLQRPEYLGGGSVPIKVNPVVQTSGTGANSDTPQGNLAAYGIVGSSGNGFTKSFVEHMTLIGLCMVRADLSYQQGLSRMWSRRTRYDFYWPALSHIGEQAVLNKEIFAQGSLASDGGGGRQDDLVFGYQERWAEYRYYPSLITGAFRSNYEAGGTTPAPLDMWHLAQNFTSLPVLSPAFIEEHPPIDRIIAVQDEPEFLFDSYFEVTCVRPMPTYSVPGFIDHF